MGDSDQLLVGSVGISGYDEVTYELGGQTIRTVLSPVALVNLCDINTALIFRTPEAGEANDDRLIAGFNEADIDYDLVDIELVTDRADIDSILRTVGDEVRSGDFEEDSVVLDISHSFRSLPIVFLLSIMQVTALEEDITLEKIYYSRFAGSREHDRSPVIDLTHLRTLMEWYDAFRMAQRTGTYREVRLLLEQRQKELFQNDDSDHTPADFSKAVGNFGAAQREIDAGFPLEAGITSKSALESLSNLEGGVFVGPEGMVLEPLERLLADLETSQDVKDKRKLRLDEAELKREAEIVAFYTYHERYWLALECARELMINRFLFDAGKTEQWLDEDIRKQVAPASGNYDERHTYDVDEVQNLWDRIRDARNTYAHAGFKEKGRMSEAKVREALEQLCEEINNDDFWRQ